MTTGGKYEAARIKAVERYRIVDTPPDRVFERIAALAARFFDAPMAMVSIVDRDRIWFAALHGIDTQLAYVAHADGLCASAVIDDGPYVVDDVRAGSPTVGTFVEDHDIAFYRCAPIVNFDGYRLGAVAVMDHRPRTSSDDQAGVLEDFAAVVMEQLELRLSSLDALHTERRLRDAAEYARHDAQVDLVNAREDRNEARRDRDLAEQERDATEEWATVLQRTLLPPSLPVVDDLELSAHYHPASPRQVGGDFYDVFGLGDGRWAFFVGDVEGHGTGAASVTSLIRYSLRSAALHHADPIDVLTELNLILLRDSDPRRFCTVLFGTLTPCGPGNGFDVTIATGGHPPALLLDPVAGTVAPIRSKGGMLIGATPNARFDSCDVHLHPGQTLLFYTDGIIEARRGDDPFDQEGLADFALEHAGRSAHDLIGDLATMIPKLEPDDDVAVLAFRAD
ncbi:PP2C family protein-serine/threonine phosphatase [Mycolicibacterium sediminis]|uniref:PPM-type phosphatase domain-containing protein n=1 Tax=Mycolicibacterium sediminis TaxID=1286180 RepID=A0A7I7R0R7_9MYCO|nr:GAF domain-containing SpoIIE family protein phosphatase [Mycolicibacterium sediminis]BBY31700.1 hypothetical protein MSEDJ_57960 [Mycolicibacterium sediminis]